MEKLTLEKIMVKIGEKNVLKLKRNLQFYKSEGILFYPGTLYNKEQDEPFELYYAVKKGNKTDHKAFPVPIQYYTRRMRRKEFSVLFPYIRSYYESDRIVEDVLPFLKVYHGKQYIWFYLK